MPEESNDPIAALISFRPAAFPDDEEFLKALYFSTREDEVAMWGMPEDQAHSLLEMQYRAQKMQYEMDDPDARHDIVMFDETPVGPLLSDRNEREVFGIDLAILPEYRSKGIGSVVIKGLMDEADAGQKPFNFSVVKSNSKAIKLYKRLGVEFTGETVSHYLLKWQAK